MNGAEVRKLISVLQSQLEDDTPGCTVADLCECYLAHCEEYYGPGRTQYRVFSVVKLLLDHHGNEPADEFGPKKLKAIRQTLIAGGMSRVHINTLTWCVKHIFKWAASEELVNASIYHALQTVQGLPKGRSKAKEMPPIKPVPDHVVEATLKRLPQIVADMVRVQRLTAMRPGEVRTLRPCDVDRSRDVWIYSPASHKTAWRGKKKMIFIGPQAQRVLAPYLDRGTQEYCFNPKETVARQYAIRRGKAGTPEDARHLAEVSKSIGVVKTEFYRADAYRKCIERAAKRAGVPIWSPSQLRHATATDVRKEFGLEAAQVILGHSRADVTQVYAEANTEKAIEIARKIG